MKADYTTLQSATTNSSYFRVIRAADGQRGTASSGVRFYSTSTTSLFKLFSCENYFGVYDLGFYFSSDTSNTRTFINVPDNVTNVKIVNSTFSIKEAVSGIAISGFLANSLAYVINCFCIGNGAGTGFFFALRGLQVRACCRNPRTRSGP